MSPDEIRVAMATIDGFGIGKLGFDLAPDYANDLNAVARVEKSLTNSQWWFYVENLTEVCGAGVALCISANALQRCEAILRTLGKWKE